MRPSTDTTKAVTASVVICTRNRAGTLDRTLGSMARLRIPPGTSWEVVVVDNGSTDQTAQVLAGWMTRLPLRVVHEARPGHSRARNAGVRAARGTIILATDDDCVVDTEWLAVTCAEFARNPGLGIVGGRVELLDPRDLPITIRTMRERIALDSVHQLSTHIIGCNMAFARRTTELLGDFDVSLGGGTPAGAAEDIDYVYRAYRRRLPIVYVPEMLVLHGHGRRTAADEARIRRAYAHGRGAIYAKYLLRGDRTMAARARVDAMFLARRAAADIRSGRWPVGVARRVYHMFVGAVGWLVTSRR